MRLWERLGVSSQMLDKEVLEREAKRFSNPGDSIGQKSNAVSSSYRTACCFYVMEEIEKTKYYGNMAIETGIDYFYSDWREKVLTDDKTIDPSWWKKQACWYEEFWKSTLWAMCLDMWDMAVKIAQYPDMECYSERTKGSPEIAYRLLLAAVIRGDNIKDYQILIDVIEKGVKKKEKLLWAVLKAIVQKDADAFNRTLLEYLKYYKKRETINHGINNLTGDGTILFNLAMHKGIDIEFPEQYRDHYICLK